MLRGCIALMVLIGVSVVAYGLLLIGIRLVKGSPAYQDPAPHYTVHQNAASHDTVNQDTTHRDTPYQDNDREDQCLSDSVKIKAEILRLLAELSEVSVHHTTRKEFADFVRGLQSEISSIAHKQKELLSSQESINARINDIENTHKEQMVMANALKDIEKKVHSIEEKIEQISDTIIESKQDISELNSAKEQAELLLKVLHEHTFDKGSMTAVILIIGTCQAGLILILCTKWNPNKPEHITKQNPEE